ncbi:two component LuxR family transcriptional regulator (plasmid) [Calothrix sp. PCC 7716]|nr:two component LuxR family transcriptional regulator [Calothrix sp. PCC 7716]
MNVINAVLIEDDEFSKFGIRCALENGNTNIKVKVVGETKFGIQGLRMVEEILPNVVVCDIGLPDIDGIQIIEKIKSKFEDKIKILVVSGNINRDVVAGAIQNGADSFFSKSTDVTKLIEAIYVTAKGESWLDSNISKILINSFRKSSHNSQHDITERELTILKLIAQGLQNDEIANKLYITEGTVRCHTHNIFTKLNVKNRIQAINQGVHLGLIDIQGVFTESEIIKISNDYDIPLSKKVKMRNFINNK